MALSIFSDLDTPLWRIRGLSYIHLQEIDTDKISADEL